MAILRAVLQKLSPKKMELSAAPASKTDGDVSRLAPLWDLQDSRQLLEVVLSEQKPSHQSMIIAIDVERNLLWLDDLFPQQRNLTIGDEITLRHHRNGEVLAFTAPIIAFGSSYGATGLAVMLPTHVDYQPRRTTQRCDLSKQAAISAKIRLMGEEPCFGTLKDISQDGICILVPGNLLSKISRDTILPMCEIRLNKELNIHCRAQVRSFRLCRDPHRATRISLQFIDLKLQQKVELEHYLHKMDMKNGANTQAA